MEATEVETRWQTFHRLRNPALREELILTYAPLVKYVIGRMVVSLPGLLDREDILSYGTIGLIQAVDRFDPAVGVKFETYAIRRIKGSIIDSIRSLQHRSRDAGRRHREVEAAYEELTRQWGRAPDDFEVAEHLGLTMTEFQTRLVDASSTIVSLNSPMGDDGQGEATCLLDHLADESNEDVAEAVSRRELYPRLVSALKRLPERDRLVITLYYYEELTVREIGEILSVSPSRVSQLHGAALLKLRALLRAPLVMPASKVSAVA